MGPSKIILIRDVFTNISLGPSLNFGGQTTKIICLNLFNSFQSLFAYLRDLNLSGGKVSPALRVSKFGIFFLLFWHFWVTVLISYRRIVRTKYYFCNVSKQHALTGKTNVTDAWYYSKWETFCRRRPFF